MDRSAQTTEKEKIVIFDVGDDRCDNNRAFDIDFTYKISHTLAPVTYLYQQAKAVDIELITPDIFLKDPSAYAGKEVLLITHLVAPRTQKLIDAGAKPLLLTCNESPFIATRFYVGLKKISSLFPYSMVFKGMKKRLSEKTIYIENHFAQTVEYPSAKTSFSEKKLFAYIASNKELRTGTKMILLKILFGSDVRSLYPMRRKIISSLAKSGSIDLYGRGWNSDHSPLIVQAYKGEVEKKVDVMEKYKFCLCLENAIFPGYITEKVFDCFFAGSVPVYFGAPDVETYLPEGTFIDLRKFKDMEELQARLTSMKEDEYTQYLSNIKQFLASPQYAPWSQESWAKQIIDLIKKA